MNAGVTFNLSIHPTSNLQPPTHQYISSPWKPTTISHLPSYQSATKEPPPPPKTNPIFDTDPPTLNIGRPPVLSQNSSTAILHDRTRVSRTIHTEPSPSPPRPRYTYVYVVQRLNQPTIHINLSSPDEGKGKDKSEGITGYLLVLRTHPPR